MKSFSKRVASFAMAAAMVCSLAVVSPVDTEAAAKPKFEKTRTAITAGTNYTYAVKNVTSKQYVKVYATTGIAVKYNNTKVTKGKTEIKGGKTIKVKINANEKVANYKGKVTVKVFNKKTNKKVKDLSDSFTVKCTKLAIKSVEPATMAANTNKYIVVNFNRALDSLDPSEVIIRKKDTNELVTVEKVALASNGKSATLTLLGDNTSLLGSTNYLAANTDYVLTVDKAGATASMDFNFPAVEANEVVSKVDASKRTITTGTGTYTVPATITVDFQDILGRTVTYWYNKNNEISKLVVANETVVYGAFGVKLENSVYTLSSKTSDDKYTTVDNQIAGSTIFKTTCVDLKDKSVASNVINANTLVNGDKEVAYAKLVLNPNGTVRTITYIAATPTSILVSSVAGNVITESKTVAANLKDYTIIKDGKTIAIADIQAGDVVFYYSTAKYAEVYTNKVTGVVTNVTDAKVTVGDKDYYYASPKYIDGNETKDANPKFFVAVKTTAKDATLFLNRFGKVVYASGDQGTVATTTREVIVKGDTKAYTLGLESYIKLNASDATDVAVPEIKLSDLKTVSGHTTLDGTTNTKIKSFDKFNTTDNKLVNIEYTDASGVTGNTIAISPAKNDIVTLTLDATNSKVVGFKVTSTAKSVSTNAAFEKGKTLIKDNNNADYQIVSSTPVFEITKDAASVTKTTYGEYDKKTVAAKNGNIKIYTDGGNVAKIVIDNSNGDMYDVTDNATVKGIITGIDKLETKTVVLTIVSEGKEIKFTSFADTVSANKASVSYGQLVDVTYDKASNKVSNIVDQTLTSVTYSDKDAAVSTNAIANGKIAGCDLATAIAPTIVTKDGDAWKVISYGELSDIAATTDYTTKKLVVKYHTMATGIIDYAVVTVENK